MMPGRSRAVPGWLPYVDLVCAIVAGGLWYARPQLGAWPLALALAPWAARLVLTGRLTRRTPFDLPLMLFLLTAGAGLWAAYDRQAAWPRFWLIVGGVLLFYAFVNAESIGERRCWLAAFLGAGMALYFLGVHDWDAHPTKIAALGRLGRALQSLLPPLPGYRLNPNEIGGILAMMVPFAGSVIVYAWKGVWRSPRPRPAIRWLALGTSLGLLTLTLFSLVMTTSRGAWIALGSALLLAGLWVVAGWLGRGSAKRRAWAFLGLLALTLGAVLGVEVFWPGGLVAAPTALPGPATWLSRVEFQRNSLTLVRDYPFIGAGLGGFQMLYSTYVLLIHVGFITHSHNLFLNVAVDQGLPGLLALVWMWLLFAGAVWRGVLQPLVRDDAAPVAPGLGAAALSLVVILVHGLADNALYGREGVLLLFVSLAFAVPFPGAQTEGAKRRLAWGVLLVGAGLLAALALVWGGPALSLIHSNLGAVRQSQAELSVYSWPEWPVQDAVRRAVDLDRPVAEYERALALDPGNATANRRLGMIELSLGEYEDALRHLEAAYAAEPESVTTRQLLGEALIVNGRLDEGRALWATVSNDQGQLDLRAFWYRHIGDAERAEWIRQAAVSR